MGLPVNKRIAASLTVLLLSATSLTVIKTKIEEQKVSNYIYITSATKIENDDLFKYALDTGLSNIIAYGKVNAVDSVRMENLDGEYMVIKKVQEEEHMKTRLVPYSCGKNTCYRTEVYYEWDVIGSEYAGVSNVEFMGINKPIEEYEGIQTKYNSTYTFPGGWFTAPRRDKFYTVPTEYNALVHLSDVKDTYSLRDITIEEYTNVNASIGWFGKMVIVLVFLAINIVAGHYIWFNGNPVLN